MIAAKIRALYSELPPGVNLVAVSKYHPVESIMEAYGAGQRLFGENRPQELAAKYPLLPEDIRWHFIGHLQTNKLKMVLPYAYLVQSIDSERLLRAVNTWGEGAGKSIRVLLEIHIGEEGTKQGLTEAEAEAILEREAEYPYIVFCGLMGMATNTDDEERIRADFKRISDFLARMQSRFPELKDFRELSIGMSGDYRIALEYGATIVRIGTGIFGERPSQDRSV